MARDVQSPFLPSTVPSTRVSSERWVTLLSKHVSQGIKRIRLTTRVIVLCKQHQALQKKILEWL